MNFTVTAIMFLCLDSFKDKKNAKLLINNSIIVQQNLGKNICIFTRFILIFTLNHNE